MSLASFFLSEDRLALLVYLGQSLVEQCLAYQKEIESLWILQRMVMADASLEL